MSPKASDLEAEAAELLRSVEFTARELNQTTLDAAREGEEARQNARMAAAMIRRYAPQQHKQQPYRNGHDASSPFEKATTTTTPSTTTTPPRITAQAKLLNLSLELERCQRYLAEEKTQHEATQKGLAEAQKTATERQADLEKLLFDQETVREDYRRQIDALERELKHKNQLLEAADQDAALALELAQSNAQAREEIEAWYQQCLDRNQDLEIQLQQQAQQLEAGGESTHHAMMVPVTNDENAPKDTNTMTADSREQNSPAKAATRAMMASGRQLLQEFRGGRQRVASPGRAASERAQERRKNLAEKIKSLNAPVATTTTTATTTFVHPQSESGFSNRIATLLRESGRRLSLPGRWWNQSSPSAEPANVVSLEETETLTKHYCESVERLVARTQNDLFELESWCALMENGGETAKK